MNFYLLLTVSFFIIGLFSTELVFAQIDPLNEIDFLQTGNLFTSENQFHISNDITIREFFYGDIVRVSGQTIEGFPYLTYSKVVEEEVVTRGMIFIGGNFVDLDFDRKASEKSEMVSEKNEDISILVQYSQRVYEKKFAQIDLKIYDKTQNKLNDYYLNQGFAPNVNIEVIITDQENQQVFSDNGTTNEKGFFQTEFYIPERSRETFTVTINAEDDDSQGSKILQIFSLGAPPDGKSSP